MSKKGIFETEVIFREEEASSRNDSLAIFIKEDFHSHNDSEQIHPEDNFNNSNSFSSSSDILTLKEDRYSEIVIEKHNNSSQTNQVQQASVKATEKDEKSDGQILSIMALVFATILGTFKLFRKKALHFAKWAKQNVKKTKYIIGLSSVSVIVMSLLAGHSLAELGIHSGKFILGLGVVASAMSILTFPKRNFIKLSSINLHLLAKAHMVLLIAGSSLTMHYAGDRLYNYQHEKLASHISSENYTGVVHAAGQSSESLKQKKSETGFMNYSKPILLYIGIILLGILMIAAACCIGCLIAIAIGSLGGAAWTIGIIIAIPVWILLFTLCAKGISQMWKKATLKHKLKQETSA